MQTSDKTARQLFAEVKANPTRKRFGFGRVPALINVDPQKAYTCVGEFATAYETDPRQLEYINALAAEFRARGFPVVWTHVAYMASGEDCGVWGTRTNTPDSLQNIKVGSRRAEFDDRLKIDRERDIIINKRMASAFFETNLSSIFTFHGVDTVVVTGGSTSGCVRATVVDSLQRSVSGSGRNGPAMYGLSAIDIALWDIRGKVLGLPVYELLGGAVRGKQVVGEQVQMSAATLFQNRDYAVLNEYRSVLGGIFKRQWGLSDSQLSTVFPGFKGARDWGLV